MIAHRRLPPHGTSNSAFVLKVALRFLPLLLLTIFIITSYLTAQHSNHYVAPLPSVLVIASAIYFILLYQISITRRFYYWISLPLVVLSVPNAINDLFPSLYMGPPDASVAPPAFALFTHIDIFLVLGLLRYGHFTLSKKLLAASFVVVITAFLTLTAYLTNIWSTNGVFGLYQLRYALLAYFLFSEVGCDNARRPFVLGLVAATFFTFTETLVFTVLASPSGHLISGNLGKNPLGHFGAAALSFFVFYRAPKAALLYKYLPLGIAALLMVGSGTRFSVVAAFASVLLVHSLRSSTLIKNAAYFLVGTLVMLTFLFNTPQGKSIVEGISHVSESVDAPDNIVRTPESSSMITRLQTWMSTAEMASTHWVTGVGPGNWSFMKDDFHIPYDGLLDPHNDLLNFIVSYGLPFGLLFYATLLVYPLIAGYRASFQRRDEFLQGCYAFILCIAFTGLTNATLWKHSIFGLTCIFACMLIFSRREQTTK